MKPLVHHRAPADLRRCEAGASAVEFALIAPVMLMLMMQIFNLGQMIYGKVLLGGGGRAGGADICAGDRQHFRC
jgi:Flp pilus assembly protein TadG